MRKSQTTLLIFCYFYFFYEEKFIFCQKTHLEKLSLYCCILIFYFFYFFFFAWQVIENAVIKHQRPYRFTLALNTLFFDSTWQQASYFNVDFDVNGLLLLFFIFQKSTFNLEKKKSICLRKFLVHPKQVTGSSYCGIVFQTMYFSKTCT